MVIADDEAWADGDKRSVSKRGTIKEQIGHIITFSIHTSFYATIAIRFSFLVIQPHGQYMV